MSGVPDPSYLTVEEYLDSEELSPIKHEYLGGVVYAMAGASDPHTILAFDLVGMLYSRLRGHPCRGYGSDMKLRLDYQASGNTYFYYPDAMIVCDPTDTGNGWRRQPAVLFEILSNSTRQIDEREKRAAYLNLGSLQAYVRIEQERPEMVVDHRTLEGWRSERLAGSDAVLLLPTLKMGVPLAELYERVTFPNSTEPSADGGASE